MTFIEAEPWRGNSTDPNDEQFAHIVEPTSLNIDKRTAYAGARISAHFLAGLHDETYQR